MANTIIFKKSNVTAVPPILTYGEPGWVNQEKRLYIGNNSSVPVLVNADQFQFPASRNANISSNQSLRRNDRTFISTAPYPIPYDGEIYCVAASRQNINLTRTWDLVVEVNASVVYTLNMTSGLQNKEDDGLSIAVTKGQLLVIYFRNASANINRPSGVVYGRRT